MTGPSPVDRGKPGSKVHVLADRGGLPLSVAPSAANVNDAFALQPLVRAIPAIRSRRGPRRRKPAKLHRTTKSDGATERSVDSGGALLTPLGYPCLVLHGDHLLALAGKFRARDRAAVR